MKRVEEQFDAFMSGFNELIPPDLVNVFDERELELLIGGIADIDVEDWKKHTDYRGYQEQDEVIQNFWKIVRTWDAEQKSRLLQFTTGTSRIPVNGFKDLQGSDGPRRFTIEKSGDPAALPKSHTWYVPNVGSFIRCIIANLFRNTASTVLISLLTRRTMRSSTKCLSRWKKRLALDRNRESCYYLYSASTVPGSLSLFPSCSSVQCRIYSLSCSGFLVFFVQCNPLLTKLSFFLFLQANQTNFQFPIFWITGLG